jgi:hypothetical protein
VSEKEGMMIYIFNMDSHHQWTERPQCVICSKTLSTDSTQPTKLKQYMQIVHQYKEKDKSFFERHGNDLKKMKLDSTKAFQEVNRKVSEAYVVALEIAKQKKTHTIGETDQTLCSQNGGNCVRKWIAEKTCSSFTIKQYCPKDNQQHGH